jgi:tRNA threonylcarbamoyladenosine biosynthesis protein TsaB
MLSLNIETSSNLTSVCISEGNEIKGILNINSERPNHCELLAPLIEKLFAESSFNFMDIKEIRVNVGPGNLSSLRVGISTANAISSFRKIPVYGIPSFLLYGNAYNKNFINLITLFDLRNNLFAYAKFEKQHENIYMVEKNFNIELQDFKQLNIADSILIGSGLDKIQISDFSKNTKSSIDKEFSIDSSALALIEIDINSEHILKNLPLMPFNSFSFVS